MSTEDWKTLFTTFSRDALNAQKGGTDDDYHRALVACEAILSGKETDNSFVVQAWKPEFGSAILTSEDILNPLTLKVFVVGLDGWTFTVDAAGSDTATCEGEPAFLSVGNVPRDKVALFVREVDHKLSLAKSKRGTDRHARNQDGGIQHTPGFLRSKCIDVLFTSHDNKFFMDPPQIIPECSGFTDVGMHTGCNARDTTLPLVQAVLKAILKFGMRLPLKYPSYCYARFMAECYLDLAVKLVEKLRKEKNPKKEDLNELMNLLSIVSSPMKNTNGSNSCHTKEIINKSMLLLTTVSRYVSQLSNCQYYWPDLTAVIATKCLSIRKFLEEVSYQEAFEDSQRFIISLPDLTRINNAPSPSYSLLQEPEKAQLEPLLLQNIINDIMINIKWLPVAKISTLTDCKAMLENNKFNKTDAYTFSIVFISIEMFLLKLAKDNLVPFAKTSKELDPDLLIFVFDKYKEKLQGFIKGGNSGGLLSNELYSHQVLISWLKFCLLFKIAYDKISLLSRFSVPLNYGDLEHLVLKDKWAWEMLDLICNFLQRHKKGGNAVIFSGREDEKDGIFFLADHYVAQHKEFNALLEKKENEAQLQIERRWKDIQRKKERCKKIRQTISQLRCEIDIFTDARNQVEMYFTESYYSGKYLRKYQVLNPEWQRLSSMIESHQAKVRDEERRLIQTQIAPAFLKHPLPAEADDAKRALFFIHMPKLLNYLWQASFEAQEMVFTDGKPIKPNGCNFYSFYEDPNRQDNMVTQMPLTLYIDCPPERYGTENVENIHDRNDGVWCPSDFSPSFVWRSGRNPFDAPRCAAVERFSEPVTNDGLKWTVIQHGSETPNDRGNLALSKLHQKPLTMTREQFLSLGNLRAQPLLQLFHLLDSIKARSLPFDDKSIQTTHTVVRQVLYHVGEINEIPANGALVKLWKFGVEPWDQGFMDTFRSVLADAVDTLKEASKNKNELLIYMEIIAFFSQFDFTFVELMDQCSDIALGWAERMEAEIQKARNESQSENILNIQENQHLFLLYALVSYEMILPEYVIEKKRMHKIVELMLRISSTRQQTRGERILNLTHRAFFFMARILPVFCESQVNWDSLLTIAVERVLPSYVDDDMVWVPFDTLTSGNQCCWMTKNTSGDFICINVLNGRFLVNGSPPSSLPDTIRNHPLFLRVFGDIDFEVTVDKNGVRKALKPVIGRYYSFQMHGEELLIYEEYEHERLLLLDASASSAWGKDIPAGIIKLYSHWYSVTRMVVFIRPVHFRKRSVYYLLKSTGLFKVPREDSQKSIGNIVCRSTFYDKYVLLDSKTKADIAAFEKFEQAEYIHPYLTHDKVFKVLLVRYRISFEFKNGSTSYECPEFGAYRLSSVQQFSDMLYGFYDYLILEKNSAELTVIFPQGSVIKSNGMVSVERPTPEEIDDISPRAQRLNKFTMHPKFKFLQGMDVLSGLQLASIQAATSSNLPEQGTQMTGFEMAIQQIRKCWVNRPLNEDEQLMLQSLLALDCLPATLIILAQQLVKCSSQLSFLYQASSVGLSLNDNAFMKAVNEYNLPLQYHLSPRNYRLSLTADEMYSFLGMNKSISHDYAMTSQAALETSPTSFQCSDGVYWRKNEDIAAFEKQLNSFTRTLTNNEHTEKKFPLKNLPLFSNKRIGAKLVTGLKKSHEQCVEIPKMNLRVGKEKTVQKLTNMHDAVKRQKEDLYMILKQKIVGEEHCTRTGKSDALCIYKAANAIPILTLYDLVQASWQPCLLQNFNPMLTENDINVLFLMVVDWMQYSVLEDKISRIRRNLESNEIDLALQELQVQRKYNPYDYPQWLAFEYDQGMQIRPDQTVIIDEILKNNDSVAQLNMGLGKTRVIVPCLLLEWSRRRHIPRVYFLSSLLDEGFDYLHQTLTGGIFTKKLFRFPFNRDVKLSIEQARILVASMKYCQIVEGAIILAPEHTLSLLLKGFELDQTAETCEISKIIREADKFPFADIFDEVDEMMCPNQELIYAEGSPIALELGPRRWGAIFSLLFHLRHHPGLLSFFNRGEVADFESDNCPLDEFNRFRLLPGKRLDKELRSMLLEIANSLFSAKMVFSPENTLAWMNNIKTMEFKQRIIKFITDPSQSSEIIKESELLHPEYFQDLLVLRGLLAYGVLIHCLKLRHDVDYGVVSNHKTLMAIPFRAANLPKLRSEFAQPDSAVTFTVLSYYNIGLTRDQVIETFSMLLSSGLSFQRRVYNEFYELCKVSSKAKLENLLCINTIDKLDLANEVQVDLLYRMYRKNMLFINFWLGNVLFPTATMVFPGKLMASSWNLTDFRKSSFRCGFSGTDDACMLLPHPLTYNPPAIPSLMATNGKMLEHLSNKAIFCSIHVHPGEQIESILANLAFEKDVDALIDAGALLSNHPLEMVADIFLSKLVHRQSRFKGIVYYSVAKCSWRVKDMRHRETNLHTSPISESDAFVIYDQSRCRGADMRLRPNAKAFLSIGPSQCKDSLMQAAGRLRQLDFGQTIIAIATPDVEILIRDCVGLKEHQDVTIEHVLCYVLFNSVAAIGNALKHWSSQGLRFLQFVHDTSHVRGEEKCDLETLYAAWDEPRTVSDIVMPKLESIQAFYHDSCETSLAVMKVIKERTQALGYDVITNYVVNFDECERELEQEREMENEKEKELPSVHPFKEKDWDYFKIFSVDSPKNLDDIVNPISVTDFVQDFLSKQAIAECSSIKWDASKIYLTSNFARPLVEKAPYDDYLRPVRLILYFPRNGDILAVSEREAEKLWRCILEQNIARPNEFPILCGVNFLLHDKTGSSVVSDMVSSPGDVSTVSHSALNLFNGQTAFCQQDQEALKSSLLLSREAASGASFFCNHRGFRVMFQGSDLEKTCNQIYQKVHALKCGHFFEDA